MECREKIQKLYEQIEIEKIVIKKLNVLFNKRMLSARREIKLIS